MATHDNRYEACRKLLPVFLEPLETYRSAFVFPHLALELDATSRLGKNLISIARFSRENVGVHCTSIVGLV